MPVYTLSDCILIGSAVFAVLTIVTDTLHHYTPSITKRTSKCADAGAFKQFGRVALVIFKFLEIAVDHVGVPVESSVAGCRRLLDRRHLARPTSAPATFTTRHQNKPRHGTLQSHHAFSALTLLVERKEENPAV